MDEDNHQKSEAVQDYLKAIYELTAGEHTRRAATNDLAARLGVRPASVSGMLQRLAAEGLVDYVKHQGARLAPDGLTVALRVIRHHRLIETFLVEMLGFEWDEIHEEAEQLEHVLSVEVTQRMADLLGNPRRDPHGDPIPTRHLHMPAPVTTCLADLKPGETGTIIRVDNRQPHLLREAGRLNLRPGVVLQLTGRDGDNLQVKLEDRETILTVGADLAVHIFIE